MLADDKEKFIEYLRSQEIGAGNFYPVPLHKQKAFNYLGKTDTLPVAESVCRRSVCLPVFPELTREEIDHICRVVNMYQYWGMRHGKGKSSNLYVLL